MEVLVRTGGFSTSKLLGRLLETFQWLVEVTNNLASIQPGGSAHITTVRVRLLHASVRHRVRKLAAKYPGYYDEETYGVPVNTLDSIHSISTFSSNQLWLQLPRFGVVPSQQEKEDYIAVMRYVAYLLGTPHDYFESTKKAKLLMESLYVHELRITETSHVVTHNFMEAVTNMPFPFNISRSFIDAGSRWINGNNLCDQLKLSNPNFIYTVIFAGQCLLSFELAWAQRLVPFFDDLSVKVAYPLLIFTYSWSVTTANFTSFCEKPCIEVWWNVKLGRNLISSMSLNMGRKQERRTISRAHRGSQAYFKVSLA